MLAQCRQLTTSYRQLYREYKALAEEYEGVVPYHDAPSTDTDTIH
jgi:hypothetical protein